MSSSHTPADLPSSGQIPLRSISVPVDVSVVLPSLNEETSVAGCVTEAKRVVEGMGLTYEIIVVDNGSDDRSATRALQAGAQVIYEPDRGYGLACRAGLETAKGNSVVIGDADGTYDFSAIPRLLALLDRGADLAIGNRLAGDMEKGAMPWLHRRVGTPLISGLIRLLFGVDVEDVNCGLRAIRRSAYEGLDIRATGMEFASEMVVQAAESGLVIMETPVDYRMRAGGEPKLRTWSDGWRHIRLIVGAWAEGRSHRKTGRAELEPAILATEPEFQQSGELDADRTRL